MIVSSLAQAIRHARRTCGLTQQQLGSRLGLKGRAVYRWERDESRPSKRHRQALVTAINAVNQNAATKLAAVLMPVIAEPHAVAMAVPAPISAALHVERAVFDMADELDVVPRRVRASLVRFLHRLRAASITLDVIHQELEARINSTPQPTVSAPSNT